MDKVKLRWPLQDFLDRTLDGRSWRAIREKAKALAAAKRTKQGAAEVYRYADVAEMAWKAKTGELFNESFASAQASCDKVLAHGGILPNEALVKLAGMAASHASERQDYEELRAIMKPWAAESEGFDVERPRICAIGETLSFKMGNFNHLVLQELLVLSCTMAP